MDKIYIAFIIFGLSVLSVGVAYGAITLDNNSRREYTWCPISDTNVKAMSAEISGCPVVRVSVNNWNSLSALEQNTIDTRMRAMGFVDAGEHIIR